MNDKLDEYIDLALDLALWSPLHPPLTPEQRNIIKAAMAFGNIYLEAAEWAEDGDLEAADFFTETTVIRRRVL
jgi:hypothetical protein